MFRSSTFGLFLFLGSALAVNAMQISNPSAASLAAKACFNYLTGNISASENSLINAGFQKRKVRFVLPSTKLGLSGHTDSVSVKLRNNECEYRFGSNRGDKSAFDVFVAAFREAGFQEMIVKQGNSRRTAFQIGNTLYRFLGQSGVSYGSYYTVIRVYSR